MTHAKTITAIMAALAFAPAAIAQDIATQAQGQTLLTAFESDNAILDTRLLFAEGARESQQNLRGAFGWPTFQEGLVENTYFRFDPDGYARFSSSPRLDEDVFEVVCRPRTYTCMAQKGQLYLMLTNAGRIQLNLDGALPTDQLSLSDGTTELGLPARILDPLEIQFERLLSTGGDLVVRRGDQIASQTSLKGFGPVSAYLRWISARQDYSVLPTGWPVPNSRTDTHGLQVTQADGWVNPMPQPRRIDHMSYGADYAQAAPVAGLQDLRQDLADLKGLLQSRGNETSVGPAEPIAAAGQIDPTQTRLQELEALVESLQSDIAGLDRMPALQQTAQAEPAQPQYPTMDAQVPWRPVTPTAAPGDPMPAEALSDEVRHLQYLVAEMGLDARTALVLMQFIKPKNAETGPVPAARSYHDTLAQTILRDLEADLAASAQAIELEQDLGMSEDKKTAPGQAAATASDPTVDLIALNLQPQNGADPARQSDITDAAQTDPATQPPLEADQSAQVDPAEFKPLSDYFNVVLNGQ